MPISVTLVGTSDQDLVAALKHRGFRASFVALGNLDAAHPAASKGPDAFIFDIREMERLPREVAIIKRQFATSGIVIIARDARPDDHARGDAHRRQRVGGRAGEPR